MGPYASKLLLSGNKAEVISTLDAVENAKKEDGV